MALLLLLAAVLGSALAKHSENVTPVTVTVYYETLCPDCQQFIPNQLFPTYADTKYNFSSLISTLTLVPYGWVQVRNASKHQYQCQHGQSECEGNRLHGCAIKHIPDIFTMLNYISCLENQALLAFKKQPFKYPIDKCQNKISTSMYQIIINCFKTNEGWELFEKNGKKTDLFFPSGGFVPYVSFNDERDDELAQKAVENLRKTLCRVTGVVDKACSS